MESANAQVPVPVDADAWRLAGQGWQWHSSSCGSCSHSSRDLCLAGDECRHPSADGQEGQQGSTQQLRSAARHLCTEMNGNRSTFYTEPTHWQAGCLACSNFQTQVSSANLLPFVHQPVKIPGAAAALTQFTILPTLPKAKLVIGMLRTLTASSPLAHRRLACFALNTQ